MTTAGNIRLIRWRAGAKPGENGCEWSVVNKSMAESNQPYRWVTEAVHPFDDHDVGSLVPPVFEAYARVFHPARRRVDGHDVPVSWQEVALANHRTAHPAMEWGSLVGSWRLDGQPGLWDDPPEQGELPDRETRELSRILKGCSSAGGVTYCLWTGYGYIYERGEEPLPEADADLIEFPQREMYAKPGSIDQAAEPFPIPNRTANLWFANDRQWCVATDIDLMTTYVGGNAQCVQEIVGSGVLEAMRVTSDQSVTWDADTVNPLPGHPYFSS